MLPPGPSSVATWPAHAQPGLAARLAGCSAVITVLAGLGTAFTVSLVGEFPLGEFVLFAAAGWTGLCTVLNQALPGELFHRRYLWWLLACQGLALLAYMIADFSWQSAPKDMARGWGRMIFLGIDVIALAYLFSRSHLNFLWLLAAQLTGDLLAWLAYGARFDDSWKFGCGIPITYAVVGLAAWAGPAGVTLVALGLSAVHFAQDFRSVGGLCLLLAVAAGLQLFAPSVRRWLLPFGALGALALGALLYQRAQAEGGDHRASRSDVDRSAMVQAAAEAFLASPLIGHGSWFSRSEVYDEFVQIRDDKAKEVGVGGFAGPNKEPEDVALHSQLLVSLAEGGLLGGAFFFAYGTGLAWTLRELVLERRWRRDSGVRCLLLLFAAWHLFMSPFSGAHRVYIAMTAGLMLIVQAERTKQEVEP